MMKTRKTLGTSMKGVRLNGMSSKEWNIKLRGKATSLKLKHPKLTYAEAKYLILDDIFTDLPDGAYFAAMAEQGLEADTIINLSESITEKGITI